VIKLLIFIILINFVFSTDMPKDKLWRKTYKECFINCIKEGISKHACNLYCIHKADEKYYKEKGIK